jgi:hypothetical protein
LWSADTIPGLDTKNKQVGFLFFIFIICCCCLVVIGIGVAGSGDGGNSGPVAPNYSANIARLGAISASI